MTTAVLTCTIAELAIAIAAIDSGSLPADASCILVASVAEAAEFDHRVLDAATAVAGGAGLPVVHLNQLIHPHHPLGWHGEDLSLTGFVAGWERAGGPGVPDAVTRMGRKPNRAVSTLAGLLAVEPVSIAWLPEHLATLMVTREPAVVVDAPIGFAALARLTRRPLRVVPRQALAAARAALTDFDPDVRTAGWRISAPSWWARLLRSTITAARQLDRPAPPAKDRAPRSDPELAAQESIAFTVAMIAALDAKLDPADRTSTSS